MDVRFGFSVIPSASGRSDPVAEALHAESLGFDLVTVWDHPFTDTPSLETWTLLTWIAARTSRIGIGSNVLGLPYRAPIVVAKMAETLDRLSGGRLVLGLGSGGGRRDFEGMGLAQRSPGQAVEALSEAVRLIRAAWSEPEIRFRGSHFRAEGVHLEPKPGRRIPIWLGVYGPRGLELAGREAEGWIPSMLYAPPAVAREKMAWVRRAAEAGGRDPDAITYAYNVGVRVGAGAPDDETRVGGEPGHVAERLAGLLHDGFTCLNLWVSGDRAEQRERLVREVLPAARELAA